MKEKSANLVKLFTAHGEMYIDTKQLASDRRHLTIYTSRGNRLKDVGKTEKIREGAMYGVHRDNLFASQQLADDASDAVWRELFGANALTTSQIRKQAAAVSSLAI